MISRRALSRHKCPTVNVIDYRTARAGVIDIACYAAWSAVSQD